MKNRFILSSFFGLLAWVLLSSNAGGYSSNTTGARGTASGCSCHGSTTTINPTVELDSAGQAVTSYVPGGSYTVKISGTSSSARPYFGFELSMVKATGAGSSSAVQAGTWGTMPSGAKSVTSSTKIMVEQNTRVAAVSGMYSISIPWTAPAAGTGSVRIYGLINGVDGTGGTGGDGAQIATNNGLTITEAAAGTLTASASIALTSGTNPACAGSSLTFTATPTNGGTAPTYQWTVNGTNAGTNSATFTTSTLASGDVVKCVMTSNLSGVAGSPATSNAITVTINTPTVPTVSQSGYVLTASAGNSYQWYLNGTAISGATSASYTATQSGDYTVAVTSAGGCSATSAATTVTVSGISNIGTNLGVKLYPIPNNGSFVIASENMHGADVVITDLYGKKVGSRKIISDRENISDLSLSPSIYLVSITHDGKTQTIKMLITRD